MSPASKGHGMRTLTALAVLLLVSLGAAPATAQVPPRCPLKLDDLVMRDGEEADQTLLVWNVYGALYDVRGVQGFKTAVMRLRDDVVVLLEDDVLDFQHSIRALLKVLGNGQYTREEMAKAVIAANQLRKGDLLFLGVLERASSKNSSSWIVATSNRGHLFEVIGARNLIRDGLVDATRVRGMGIRAYKADGTYLVEGDLVEAIAGGDRFIDFKAAGGNYSLDEVGRVFDALDAEVVNQFVFAHEAGASLPQALQVKIGEVNAQIFARNQERAAQGLPALNLIEVWDAGTF